MLEPYSLKYTIPYIIIFCAYLLLAFSKIRNTKDARIICTLIFIIFFGFRGFVGWDWLNYYPLFNNLSFNNISFGIDDFLENPIEPGFRIYSTIIKELLNDWILYILISVIIDCLFLNHFFKKYSVNYPLSFLLYFCLCIGTQFDLLRNVKAIMLFLLGIDYIIQRDLKKYIIVILLACLFHLSSIVFLLLYPIGSKGFSFKTCLWIFLIANVLYLSRFPLATYLIKNSIGSFIPILQLKLEVYSDVATARGITIGYIIRIFLSILILWKYKQIVQIPNMGFFISIYFISVAFILGLSELNVVSQRMEALLQPAICALLPSLISSIRLKRNKSLISSFIVLYGLMYIIRASYIGPYYYENILWGADSYEERARKDYNTRIIISKNNE